MKGRREEGEKGRRDRWALMLALATATAAGCGGSTPTAEPAPVPAPAPAPPPVSAPPTTTLLTPARVAGTYRLTATIASQRPQPQGRGRGRQAAAPAATQLRLLATPPAAPDPAVASASQFSALANLRGYTRAPRGRAGQAAAWYPIPGDSIVVQFATAAQAGAQVQLRGAVAAREIRGDVWLVTESGSSFQLGTFVATR